MAGESKGKLSKKAKVKKVSRNTTTLGAKSNSDEKLKNNKESVAELEKKIATLESEVRELESEDRGGSSFWRSFGMVIFLSLSVISLLLLNISFWAKDTLLNNKSFVSTVSPVLHDKDVQDALTVNISSAIFDNINVEQLLKDNLPEQATFLAAPLASQIKSYTTSEIGKLIASDKAYEAWTTILATGHKTLVNFIENNNTNGTITVNDLYQLVGNELQGSSISFLFNKNIPDKIGQFQLTQVEWLPQVKQYLNIIKDLPLLLSMIFVISLMLVLVLARNKRKVLLVALPIFALSMLLVLLTLSIANSQVVNQVGVQNGKAASAVFEIITSPLRDQTIARLWLFVALFVVVLMMSPYKWVKFCISKIRFYLDWIANKTLPKFSGPDWLNTISNSRFIVSVVFVSVVFVIFNLKQPPNVDNVIWASIISVIGVLVLEVASALSRLSTKGKVK